MMNPVKTFRTGVAAKAAGVNALPFTQASQRWWTPRGKVDTSKVGDGTSNSAVFAVINSMGRAYAEPEVREYQRIDGQDEEVTESPAAQLLNAPNPYMEIDLLWSYSVAAIAASGSAYLHKVRNQLNQVIQLWPLYPSYVKPHTPDGGGSFIDYWRYTPPGIPEQHLPPEDIVQLRWLLDPNDFRLGWSPLQQVLNEVLTDDEAAQFSNALLTNMGVPGVVITSKDPQDPGPQGPAKDAMNADYKAKFGGNKRGEPWFIGGGVGDVKVVSFSPEQMDLTALRRLPEERISGVLGWPAILAHLGAGLEHGTYANAGQLREFATEQSLAPLWGLTGKQLTRQVLREFQESPMHKLAFDLTEVRALQKDEDDMVKRLDTAIQGGWALVSEGRREIGLPVEKQHEVFLRGVSTMAVGVTEDATLDVEPEPVEA